MRRRRLLALSAEEVVRALRARWRQRNAPDSINTAARLPWSNASSVDTLLGGPSYRPWYADGL